MIETDYLVVGAGAAGMAFTDELIAHVDAEVVLVDRRDRPGGHWNDAYPFVRLHQASANYGVNSQALGTDSIDSSGSNAGFYERATGGEICDYFHGVLEDHLLPSGRVRFLGMCDYVGDWSNEHAVTSRLTGSRTTVRVRRRVVDATYLDVQVPATHTPSFTVDPDAHVIPIGGLVDLGGPPTGFTVLGAGKTAMDACTWLLEHGVDPDRIRWIRSRDVWLLDRAALQPLGLVVGTMEAMASWTECLAHAGSTPDLFRRLEESGGIFRLDPSVEPSVFRAPILSQAEITGLRKVERVVRHGRVRHVGAERIVLADSEIPTGRGEVHVDCTASGFRRAPPRPIFEPGRITLQSLIGGFTTQYAALMGFIEATRDDDTERNRVCPPTPQVTLAEDWVSMMRGILHSSALHATEPDLTAWSDRSRLSFTCGLSQHMDDPRLAAAMARWAACSEPALKNAEVLLAGPASN
ncbi:MAG TPA: FAD/NAD(P)-binding protein [Acidimicrobiia bacterium]|nr:FAD/NAD(P)-binding protein [Acidimicrobiia bacterium]